MKQIVLAAAFALALGIARAEPLSLTAEELSAAGTVAGDIYVRGHAFEYVASLSDELGPRLTGSEQFERAVHWAVDQFHAMGIARWNCSDPVSLGPSSSESDATYSKARPRT